MSSGTISSMMGTNVDQLAEVKQVYYRPDTAADTVRVGDLVCYNWDLATDYKERGTTPASGGTAYAEGSQNYTGRICVVEKPATANLQFFAGVVAALGDKAGADGDLIEIYIPNGAVVPVMSDQYCTNGRTIVAVRNGVYEGSYPSSTARPIGIAMETKDRSTTDGLVWTKVDPNMFAWNYHSSKLLIDDEGLTGDHIVHKINIDSSQTGGRFTAFEVIATSSGGAHTTSGGCGFGCAAYFEANITASITNHFAGVGIWVNATGGTIGEYLCALEVGLYEDGATMTGSGRVSVLALSAQMADAVTPGYSWIWMAQNGAVAPDYLIETGGTGFCGDVAMTADHTFDTADRAMPVRIGGATYYIPLMNNYGD